MPKPRDIVGQAKMVLVFGNGDAAKAVMSTVGVRTLDESESQEFHFAGPVAFKNAVVAHLQEVVLPLARDILSRLGLSLPSLEISVANIGAASSHDIGMRISGFSADVPIFLAVVSAGLGIPIRQDVVSTGHLASPNGDIRMVKGLVAKVRAAIKAKAVRLLVHPAWDADSSLEVLSPSEKDQVETALAQAKNDFHTAPVHDAAELLAAVFREEGVIEAALCNGYYLLERRRKGGETPIERATAFFYEGLEQRFWSCLERNLLAGERRAAGHILLERMHFHVCENLYPNGFGTRLFRILQSLPPSTRRLKLKFPLVPEKDCLDVGKLAHAEHFDDLRNLFDAIAGDRLATKSRMVEVTGGMAQENASNALLENTLSEISPETLSMSIGLPIDEARATYIFDSVTVESGEAFYDLVSSFYLHLVAHARNLDQPVDRDKARPEAYALLDRAFAQQGGAAGAFAESRDAVQGGMRHVLDAMTAQFSRESKEKQVNAVFKEALGSLDWERRVAFMAALLNRLRTHLPSEIFDGPAERFVHHIEPIARAYVESLEGVKQLLRSL